jgi:cytochrome c-type biogenesis protein CcmH
MRVPIAAMLLPATMLAMAALAPIATALEPREFPSEIKEERYRGLIDELRCLVCQNQNLTDSDADLARDLRERVHQMLLEGHTDAEILDFMTARYGDFVLYRPPWRSTTVLLWAGPFVLAGLGLVLLVGSIRARPAPADSPALDPSERARLAALVGEEGGEAETAAPGASDPRTGSSSPASASST